MKLGGVVLCGGKSSRMGTPKAWLPFGEEFLLQRVVKLLSETASPVVVVAAPNQDLPTLSVQAVRDPEPHRGPLQGLQVGLSVLRSVADAAYVTGCDYPFLEADFVRKLAALLGDGDFVLPQLGNYFQPLSAIYRTSLSDRALSLLQAGHSRLLDLVEASTGHIIQVEKCDSVRNINTPEEYTEAVRVWQGERSEDN